MNVSNLCVRGEIIENIIEQLEVRTPEITSNPKKEHQFGKLGNSSLKSSFFKANNASKNLFNSSMSNLSFDTPFYLSPVLIPPSPSDDNQKNVESRYSSFTKSIKNTPPLSFHIPPPTNNKLTQRLSNEEFSRRNDLYRNGKNLANLISDPFLPDISCVSLTKGMNDEQKKQFNNYVKNVDEGVELRSAMAPFIALDATSRIPFEFFTTIVAPPVNEFCTQNPINEMICTQVRDLSLSVVKKGGDFIPDSIKKPIEGAYSVYHNFVEEKACEYESKFQIDTKETRNFYSGVLDLPVTAGIFKIANVSAHIYKNTSSLLPSVSIGRIGYSKGYWKSVDCFVEAKEFEGILSKELMVVQYHSGGSLNQGRSLKWFTSITEGNKFSTMDQVMDKLALLSEWGERTHVTVVKIPAGESVKFLHGRAIEQMSSNSLELVKGGGVQYRFYEFDPKWILETRRLP